MNVHCSLGILLILHIFKYIGVDIVYCQIQLKCITEIFNVKLFDFLLLKFM